MMDRSQNDNKPQQYYIVSIKHTSKGDAALTLWGPNNAGYFWDKSMAGVYTEEQAAKFKGDENNRMQDIDRGVDNMKTKDGQEAETNED